MPFFSAPRMRFLATLLLAVSSAAAQSISLSETAKVASIIVPPAGAGAAAGDSCTAAELAVVTGNTAAPLLLCHNGFLRGLKTNLCGNGVVDIGEACDDGNAQSGDGCSDCAVEADYACSGEPSVCSIPPGYLQYNPIVALDADDIPVGPLTTTWSSPGGAAAFAPPSVTGLASGGVPEVLAADATTGHQCLDLPGNKVIDSTTELSLFGAQNSGATLVAALYMRDSATSSQRFFFNAPRAVGSGAQYEFGYDVGSAGSYGTHAGSGAYLRTANNVRSVAANTDYPTFTTIISYRLQAGGGLQIFERKNLDATRSSFTTSGSSGAANQNVFARTMNIGARRDGNAAGSTSPDSGADVCIFNMLVFDSALADADLIAVEEELAEKLNFAFSE